MPNPPKPQHQNLMAVYRHRKGDHAGNKARADRALAQMLSQRFAQATSSSAAPKP